MLHRKKKNPKRQKIKEAVYCIETSRTEYIPQIKGTDSREKKNSHGVLYMDMNE